MWDILKEYAKPVGLVILGVLGARVIEGAYNKGVATVSNIQLPQFGQPQQVVVQQTPPQTVTPAQAAQTSVQQPVAPTQPATQPATTTA